MTTEQIVAFLLFAVVAAVTPGPSNIMLTAAGAQAGALRGLPCLLGVTTGHGCHDVRRAARARESRSRESPGIQGAPLGRRCVSALAVMEDRDVRNSRRLGAGPGPGRLPGRCDLSVGQPEIVAGDGERGRHLSQR